MAGMTTVPTIHPQAVRPVQCWLIQGLGLAGTPTTPGTGPCSDRARAGYLWFWGMTTVPQTMTMILVALQSPDVMQFLGCKNDPNPTYCLGKASKETDHHTILLQWIAWGWLAMHWLPAL